MNLSLKLNNLINLSFSLENVRRGEYITIFNNDDVLNNRLHTLLPYDNGFGSIGPQRLLRKFSIPSYSNIKTETLPGGVGMFVNGVEAFSYKSSDVIYYGSLENVEVLNTVDIVKEDDTHDKVIVAVKQNNLLATAFHPELTDDSRWHQYFVEDIVKKKS